MVVFPPCRLNNARGVCPLPGDGAKWPLPGVELHLVLAVHDEGCSHLSGLRAGAIEDHRRGWSRTSYTMRTPWQSRKEPIGQPTSISQNV